MATADRQQGSILSGTLWMIGLAIVLFWLPVVGPLIAGFVGGKKSGGIAPALLSSLIPGLLAAGLFLLLGTAVGLPLIGAIVGAGVFIVLLVELVPMMLAAIVGGAMAE